jgi:ABC-2 type transport system ATP-binding protein
MHCSSSPAPLQTMKALEGAPGIGDVAVFGGGLHVSVDDPESGMHTIRARLAAEGIEVRRIEKIMPSREDVFGALIEAETKKTAGGLPLKGSRIRQTTLPAFLS